MHYHQKIWIAGEVAPHGPQYRTAVCQIPDIWIVGWTKIVAENTFFLVPTLIIQDALLLSCGRAGTVDDHPRLGQLNEIVITNPVQVCYGKFALNIITAPSALTAPKERNSPTHTICCFANPVLCRTPSLRGA